MPLRKIIVFPDRRLRLKAHPVTCFDDSLRCLADDMLETMYDAPGIGLAATQIGDMRRVITVDCSSKDTRQSPAILVNPVIGYQSNDLFEWEEGCLSLPGQFANIRRPQSITVSFKDIDGGDHEATWSDLWSICIQHEIDHLDGKLFIDRLSVLKRRMITSKLAKAAREKG